MAAPTATGCAALMLQDFRNTFPGQPDYLPSTQKGLFIHTALDLETVGPDYKTGYGTIRVKDAIDFMRTGQFTEASISTGQSHPYLHEVTTTTSDLTFTLVWDDPAATPNVIPSLVNDLDLIVTGPGGTSTTPGR